jgi:glycosyltransferase involved in cell wall biosynthesis
MPLKCSLVISTYKWPKALELVLLSIKRQKIFPNEVIIGDDGSGIDTKELIERFQKDFPVPLIHLWHEDNGHQKTVIMNKAIAKSRYEYIIEIDGDIIVQEHFVEDHLSMAQEGTYLYGSRVNIQKSHLEKLFEKKQIDFNYFSSGIKKRNRTLRIPFLADLEKRKLELSKKLRGCNMSFWRSDFIAVNGYNEDLKGWGSDDSELIQRMVNNGVSGKRLKNKGIVYHIYHHQLDRSKASFNLNLENRIKKNGNLHIENGVSQHL